MCILLLSKCLFYGQKSTLFKTCKFSPILQNSDFRFISVSFPFQNRFNSVSFSFQNRFKIVSIPFQNRFNYRFISVSKSFQKWYQGRCCEKQSNGLLDTVSKNSFDYWGFHFCCVSIFFNFFNFKCS